MNNYRLNIDMPQAVKVIILINVVMYFLTKLIELAFGNVRIADYLGLHLVQSQYWAPYQYITHMFMHGSISHLFFNMFAVYTFGRILENVWGIKRFLFFYFFTGLGAALLNSLVGWFEVREMVEQYKAFLNTPDPGLLAEFVRSNIPNRPSLIWNTINDWSANPASLELIEEGKAVFWRAIQAVVNVPTIGASGAVFGILIAFGMLFPNTELFLMFIPIPIKAKYLVIGYGLIELYMGIQNNVGDHVAHFAHLGGMLFGFILLKYWNKQRKRFY